MLFDGHVVIEGVIWHEMWPLQSWIRQIRGVVIQTLRKGRGGILPKKSFQPFGPQFGLKIRGQGAGGRPPGPLPQICHCATALTLILHLYRITFTHTRLLKSKITYTEGVSGSYCYLFSFLHYSSISQPHLQLLHKCLCCSINLREFKMTMGTAKWMPKKQ